MDYLASFLELLESIALHCCQNGVDMLIADSQTVIDLRLSFQNYWVQK